MILIYFIQKMILNHHSFQKVLKDLTTLNFMVKCLKIKNINAYSQVSDYIPS